MRAVPLNCLLAMYHFTIDGRDQFENRFASTPSPQNSYQSLWRDLGKRTRKFGEQYWSIVQFTPNPAVVFPFNVGKCMSRSLCSQLCSRRVSTASEVLNFAPTHSNRSTLVAFHCIGKVAISEILPFIECETPFFNGCRLFELGIILTSVVALWLATIRRQSATANWGTVFIAYSLTFL